MTRGVMVLLSACMLIVITARVSSLESDLAVAMHPPGMAPAYAPEKPHYPHAPEKAPVYPPTFHYPHAPEKAPVYPPTKSVAPTPEPEAPKRCDGLCLDYCKPILTPKKRMCQRVCTECCAKCDCVPEKGATCKNWDVVLYHGVSVRCP
ncbi:gibberellin-regulated protein 14-like isoform X2 [Rhododendron vialii]|uniref:gibberellin-regulated protein 14-like isoform X2 n=1 Tax=Rhododendron vialii TaxID=182163 RepID=UPI00265E8F5E|nr:gibberellin-regulated protein 14-like isoform X2 [Rhododendron vialii]